MVNPTARHFRQSPNHRASPYSVPLSDYLASGDGIPERDSAFRSTRVPQVLLIPPSTSEREAPGGGAGRGGGGYGELLDFLPPRDCFATVRTRSAPAAADRPQDCGQESTDAATVLSRTSKRQFL